MRFRSPIWGAMVVCLLVAGLPTAAAGATIAVPAGGDLQAAINAAMPGDVITLAPGAVYVGNFTLPDKGSSAEYITIRSAAPDSALPPAGVRITPAFEAQLPKIQSATSVSSLRTKTGAHHWKLMFLEFRANYAGYGDIMELGMGDASQYDLSQVPHDIVVDRVYVHGDPVMGQKRGIALNSRDTQVLNCYISDIKAVGQDAQALGGFNGPGNYLIENNYLEGAGENFLLGGADPPIKNLVTTNVTFRRNHLRKPLEWRNAIIATPQNVQVAAAVGAGSLAAGTYAYRVAARVPAGQTTKASSTASVEVTATLSATGAMTVSWTPVAGATEYFVYGRTSGSTNQYWKTTNPYFTDTGAAGTAGSPVSATKWVAKNLFELKNAQDIVVEGNVFENNWVGDQPGYGIVFTPRNQSGTAPWVVVQRVVFRQNLVRHSAGGVNILGTDNNSPSQLTNNLAIVDNIWDDIGGTWGTGSKTFQIGDGADHITFDHNTVDSTDSSVVAPYGGSATSPTPIPNFVYTNNMSEHGKYGFMGANMSPGMSTINAYFPGSVIRRNVLAGGSASKYPADNFFPTVAAWKADFVAFDAADYHLLPTSAFISAAIDGGPLGANVDAVLAHANIALSGDNRTQQGIPTVQIATSSLPDAMYQQPYSQPLVCTGIPSPCGWSLVDATLPAGLSFDASTGVLSGTPTAVQTGLLTVMAYDPSWPSNSATTTLTVTVDAPLFTMTVDSPAQGQVGSPYRLNSTTSGALAAVAWSVVSGSLPSGLSLDAASGTVAGTPTAWGTSTAVIQAADTWQAGRVAQQAVTITVSPAPLSITTSSLGAGTYQQYFQTLLSATGGSGSIGWKMIAGALPTGVLMDASGSVSGTPTAVGNFNVTVEATDANWTSNQTTAALAMTVAAPPFTASMPVPPPAQVGVPYQIVGSTAGQVGVVVWSIASGALPGGVSLNSSTGAIAGVPTAAGTYSAVVQARDSWDATRTVLLPVAMSVAPAPISVATSSVPPAAVNRSYLTTLSANGGTGLTTWSLASGSLPAGLTLASNGTISGTPSTVESKSFTVRATDTGWPANTATAALTLTVQSGEVVLYASDATQIAGKWSIVADSTAAGGKRIWNPDLGAAKLADALASPASYFEITFQAQAGVAYHLWVRGKADKNNWANDSAFVQFSDSVDAANAAVTRIGTTDAEIVTIENGINFGLSGWGWNDNSYLDLGTPIRFATTGTHTLRVQVREDGLSIDQIVLSPQKYLTTAPGAAKNDATILAK